MPTGALAPHARKTERPRRYIYGRTPRRRRPRSAPATTTPASAPREKPRVKRQLKRPIVSNPTLAEKPRAGCEESPPAPPRSATPGPGPYAPPLTRARKAFLPNELVFGNNRQTRKTAIPESDPTAALRRAFRFFTTLTSRYSTPVIFGPPPPLTRPSLAMRTRRFCETNLGIGILGSLGKIGPRRPLLKH